jgi:hypothetical protein
MNVIRSLLVLLAAFLSMGLTEVFGTVILATAPLDLDLTANLFLSVVVPAVLLTQVLMAFIFWKAFEANPIRNSFIYVIAHAVFQAIELNAFFNPPADILAYVIIICSCGLLVTTVFNRYFWCAACARVG